VAVAVRLSIMVFLYQQQQQIFRMALDRQPELWRFGIFGELQPTVTVQRCCVFSCPF
jgi:hypothetical protein